MAAKNVTTHMRAVDNIVIFELNNFLQFLYLKIPVIKKPDEILLFLFFEPDLLEELFLHFLKFLIDIFGLLEFAL